MMMTIFKDCSDHGRERAYFISAISVSAKVESFGLGRKNLSVIESETKSAKKLCQKADAGYWKMLL